MRQRFRAFREELPPTLALAWPVVLSELGWMAMGLVDTVMVGRLGPEAIGAVGLGNVLYFGVIIVAIGLLLGLDTVISQAFGAGRMEDCHRWLFHGTVMALALVPAMMAGVALIGPLVGMVGVDPAVVREARPYLRILNLGTAPLLVYFVFRRYVQAIGVVKPIMITLLLANVVNLLGNWVFVYGRLGMPALGVAGSAWSTFLARVVMLATLGGVIVRHDRRARTALWEASRRIEWARIRELLVLGLPAAGHLTLEVGVFAVATTLVGRLGPVSLAAHEIAMNVCSLTFMVPMGVSSAAAVRVGHAVGRGDPAGAGRAGWTGLALGGAFMLGAAVTFVALPRTILSVFTADSAVVTLGISLLLVGAMFQLFDGLQVVATGVLRGVGDTHTPMKTSLFAYWVLGLPVGYALVSAAGWGATGMWLGLSAGLIASGMILMTVWARTVRTLIAEAPVKLKPPVEDEWAAASV